MLFGIENYYEYFMTVPTLVWIQIKSISVAETYG